jgi:hypothetical protein
VCGSGRVGVGNWMAWSQGLGCRKVGVLRA